MMTIDELLDKAMQAWFGTRRVERSFYGGEFEEAMRSVIAVVLAEATNIDERPLIREIPDE